MKNELEYTELDYSPDVPVPPLLKMPDYIQVMCYLIRSHGVIPI